MNNQTEPKFDANKPISPNKQPKRSKSFSTAKIFLFLLVLVMVLGFISGGVFVCYSHFSGKQTEHYVILTPILVALGTLTYGGFHILLKHFFP